MSYSEVDGKVVLTMSKADYLFLLFLLGVGSKATDIAPRGKTLIEFINGLNEGNQEFVPYR